MSQNTPKTPAPKRVLPKGFIPWKPGQSGNPGGRPKEAKAFREWCQRYMAERGMESLTVLADVAKDERVRVAALRLISEYAYGKAPQPIEGTIDTVHQHFVTVFERADVDVDAPRPEQRGAATAH